MRKWPIILIAVLFGLGLWVVSSRLLDRSAADRLPDLPALAGQPSALAGHLRTKDRRARENPEEADAIGELGKAYQADRFYDQAVICYRLASELAPGDWRWKYYPALIFDEMGAAQRASELLREVVVLEPDHSLAWFRLGQSVFKLGAHQEAGRAYTKALSGRVPSGPSGSIAGPSSKSLPIPAYAAFGLARVAFQQGRLQDASRLLARLVGDHPGFGAAHRLFARVNEKSGRLAEAEEHRALASRYPPYTPPADPWVDELARESRSSTYLLKQMGVARIARNGPWAEALARRAVEVDPNDTDAVIALGLLLLKMGRPDEAVEYLDRYHRMRPEDYPRLSNFAVYLSRQGKFDQAERMLTEAIRINPRCAEAHSNLGTILSQRGHKERAWTHLNRALELDPEDAEILTNIGTVLARQGEVERAKGSYRKALDVDPSCAPAHLGMGGLLVLAGNWADALGHFEAARKIRPADAGTMERLAWLLATCPVAKIRDGARAVALAERANRITGGKQVRFLNTLAAALAESGRFDRALETMRSAIELARKQSGPGLVGRLQTAADRYAQGDPYRLANPRTNR